MTSELHSLLFALSALLSGQVFPAEPLKPNILVILTDDHGWADLGAQGVDKDIRTPNLDQLARDGVRFKRGYVTAPQCTPVPRRTSSPGAIRTASAWSTTASSMRSEVVTLAGAVEGGGLRHRHQRQVASRHRRPAQGRRDRRTTCLPELGPQRSGLRRIFHRLHAGLQRLARARRHALSPTRRTRSATKRCRVVIQTEAGAVRSSNAGAKRRTSTKTVVSSTSPTWPRTCRWSRPSHGSRRRPQHLPKERRSRPRPHRRHRRRRRPHPRASSSAMGQEQNTLIFFIGDNGAPLADARRPAQSLGRLPQPADARPERHAQRRRHPRALRRRLARQDPRRTGLRASRHQPRRRRHRREALALRARSSIGAAEAARRREPPPATSPAKTKPPRTTRSTGAGCRRPPCRSSPGNSSCSAIASNLLFDITQPRGRSHRAQSHPRKSPTIAARLLAKLEAWYRHPPAARHAHRARPTITTASSPITPSSPRRRNAAKPPPNPKAASKAGSAATARSR